MTLESNNVFNIMVFALAENYNRLKILVQIALRDQSGVDIIPPNKQRN